MAKVDPARNYRQAFGVASAKHDVVSLQRGLQLGDNLHDGFLPLLFPPALEACSSAVVFKCLAALVGKVGEFHGFQDAVHNERGAKASAQAQEQHAATAVAAERLHGSVVDDLDRTTER